MEYTDFSAWGQRELQALAQEAHEAKMRGMGYKVRYNGVFYKSLEEAQEASNA